MYDYSATVLKVIDGDTVRLTRDCGCDIEHKMKIRLAYIDAPELNTSEGKAARDYLKELVEGKEVRLFTIKDRTEKYGRYLGEIYLDWGPLNGKPSVNQMMIDAGHAKPYDGGKR